MRPKLANAELTAAEALAIGQEEQESLSTSLPRAASSLLPLAQLPALSLQHFLDLVQHLHLLRRALAVLGPVRRRDDHSVVGNHLGVVPAHGDVTISNRKLSAINPFTPRQEFANSLACNVLTLSSKNHRSPEPPC
jgi:hypothetical protein